MFKFIKFLFLIVSLTGCSVIEVEKIGVRSGFTYTHLRQQSNQQIIPTRVTLELRDPSNLLDGRFGRIQPTIELIGDSFLYPDVGVLAGVCPMLKYSIDLNSELGLHLVAGAGLSYLSLDTYEQGSAGFNFIDQIGAGIEYDFGSFELDLDYRFAHISHANLRPGNNNGIDTHSILLGIRFPF